MIVPGWRWQFLSPQEVLSPEGLDQLNRNILLVSTTLLDKLEEFRKQLGLPIRVNHNGLLYRGYRSPRENKEIVKGEEYSFHMQGLAADISCYEIPLEELHARAIKFGFHGIGFYPSKNFIHVDIRPRLAPFQVLWKL